MRQGPETAPQRDGLQNKIALVTGANTGMGKVVATELARRGATVILVARDRGRGEAARAEIAAATGNPSIDLRLADLSALAEVRRLAQEVAAGYPQLHILVNNAGAILRRRQETADGLEMNMAINHLSSFLLTNLLLDTLRAGAPARVVHVASNAMSRAMNLDDLQSARKYASLAAYGQSKLAMVLCTYALARRLDGAGVTVNALHPGITGTQIIDAMAPPAAAPLARLAKRFLQTPEQGAQTALYLATAPAVAGVSGKYFIRSKEGRSVPNSYDTALQERVWRLSADLVGLAPSA
jgi:NAD(P)-dependent dehydrogenase (short-subunit alcohol dehydrogenase family)